MYDPWISLRKKKNTTKESMQRCAYFTAMIELVIGALSGS
jgi:hypothetical protein